MMISVVCPNCGERTEYLEEKAGKMETCTYCKKAVLVPNPFTEAEQHVSISHVIKALPGSASNPFRGLDREAIRAAVQGETIKPYRLLGIIGALVLGAATFLPIRGLPDGTAYNCFQIQYGSLGTILWALAVMGLSLTLTRSTQGLLAVALGALGVIISSFFEFLDIAVPQVAVNRLTALEVRWGWSILLVGALLMLAATIWGERLPIKRHTKLNL
jgi:hypothetical protein